MFYVGLDIHSKHVAMCVLDENGKVFRRAKVRAIHDALSGLAQLPDRFEVCYEASCGYGFYHDALRPLTVRVVVAHPGHLCLIFCSKHKNDRHDAEKLIPGERASEQKFCFDAFDLPVKAINLLRCDRIQSSLWVIDGGFLMEARCKSRSPALKCDGRI